MTTELDRQVEAPTVTERGNRARRLLASAWATVLASGLLSTLLLVPVLTSAHPRLPFAYNGDALSTATHVKTVLERGWVSYNPRIGAPWGRHFDDFPAADNLHLLIVSALRPVTHDWALVLNAYFLVGFPLAAMTATWFLRQVGTKRLLAVVLGALYAYAPYHFQRGENHLFLSAYYVVPPACLLLVRAVGGESLWTRRPEAGRAGGLVTRRNAATVATLVVLGTASSYYSVFTLLLLSGAAVLALLQDGRWRRLLGVIAAQGLLVAVMVVNMLPNLLYERHHVANLVALRRAPDFSERYALKLTQLVLPWSQHRIGRLAAFRTNYDQSFPFGSERPALGAVAAFGMLALLVLLLRDVVRRGPRAVEHPTDPALRRLSALTLLAFLLGTIGGLSTLFALFVSPNIRGWNRLVIVLMMFGLAGTGLLLQRWLSWGRLAAVTRFTLPAVAVVLLVGGVFDQTPASYPPNSVAVAADVHSDQQYVAALEARLPAGAMVFQLPYLFFPEARPVVGEGDSQPYRMYLQSKTLRWSFGGVRGRPDSDWAADISSLPTPRLTAMVTAAGFSGISVDRKGYVGDAAALEKELAGLLHEQPIVSPDQRWSFWDTRGYATELRARHPAAELAEVGRHVVLHPVPYLSDPGTTTTRLFLDNPRSTAQPADVDLRIVSAQLPSALVLHWPDGTTQTLDLSSGAADVHRRITLPPGRSEVGLSVPADARTAPGSTPAQVVYQRVVCTLTDPVLAGFQP